MTTLSDSCYLSSITINGFDPLPKPPPVSIAIGDIHASTELVSTEKTHFLNPANSQFLPICVIKKLHLLCFVLLIYPLERDPRLLKIFWMIFWPCCDCFSSNRL